MEVGVFVSVLLFLVNDIILANLSKKRKYYRLHGLSSVMLTRQNVAAKAKAEAKSSRPGPRSRPAT